MCNVLKQQAYLTQDNKKVLYLNKVEIYANQTFNSFRWPVPAFGCDTLYILKIRFKEAKFVLNTFSHRWFHQKLFLVAS